MRPGLLLGAQPARRPCSSRARGAHPGPRARDGAHRRGRRVGGVHGTQVDGPVHGALGRVDPDRPGPSRGPSPVGLDCHRCPPCRHRAPVDVRVLPRPRRTRSPATGGSPSPGPPSSWPDGSGRATDLPRSSWPGWARRAWASRRTPRLRPPSSGSRTPSAGGVPTPGSAPGSRSRSPAGGPSPTRWRSSGEVASWRSRFRPAMSDPGPSVHGDEGSQGGQGPDRVRAGAAGDGGVRGDPDPVPAVGRARGGQDRRGGVRDRKRLARGDLDLQPLRTVGLRRPADRQR